MVDHGRFRDMPAITLESDALRAVILPTWGGKIASLYDKQHGREWLHINPHLPFAGPTYDGDYVGAYDVGGFDECFPNVGAGPYPVAPWQGTPLPDHGEVWALPWIAATVARDEVHLACYGVRLPYRLEKSIRLVGPRTLRMEYAAYNPTPFPMPVIWSSHPILAIEPGMLLDVPATTMRVDGGQGALPVQPGEDVPWPVAHGVDLSRVPEPDANIAVKLFTRDLETGGAHLTEPESGASISFRFDETRVTHVGLWLNYGGWAGAPAAPPYFNLAVEPCIGVADHLHTALQEDTHATIPADGAFYWWLEVAIA